jgi:peroxiredoxin
MKKSIQSMALTALTVLGLTACNNQKFQVEGTVEGAQDSILYFENVGLNGPVALDSVKLGADGSFSFSEPATEAPEFYRLRIGDQIINVSIDSTETVSIKAQYPNMAARYEIEGSDNCAKIRELALKQIALQNQTIALQQSTTLTPSEARDSLSKLIDAYKKDVEENYIYKAPNKAYAYFALFQTLGPWLIFNPDGDRDDSRAFAAVATSWDTYYPGAERGENLHNIALKGMNTQRIMSAKNQVREIDTSRVKEAGIIDITLPDNKGKNRSLSELKGQVVLLDFHVFAVDESPKRILMMRELYNKYHAQGLEIYQVSLDPNEHFWKQQTASLPWISVRDEDGLNSRWLTVYNIQNVPDYFLIDRGNNLVKRSAQIKDIETEVRALL